MKKNLVLIIALFAIFTSVAFADDLLPVKSYPKEITEYIAKHFGGEKILRIEKDIDENEAEYSVKLKNKIKLEFNSEFQIKEIKAKKYIKFPESVFPPKILETLKKDYPNCEIKSWEIDKQSQEIKLKHNNKIIELDFGLTGDLRQTSTRDVRDDD